MWRLLTENEEAPTQKCKSGMPDKRPSEGGGKAGGVHKRRRLRVGGSQAPKSALTHLHEMKPGLVFHIVSNGPEPRPNFTMSVMLDGEKYSGNDPNKKVAKQRAAESVLAYLLSSIYGVTVGFSSPHQSPIFIYNIHALNLFFTLYIYMSDNIDNTIYSLHIIISYS